MNCDRFAQESDAKQCPNSELTFNKYISYAEGIDGHKASVPFIDTTHNIYTLADKKKTSVSPTGGKNINL